VEKNVHLEGISFQGCAHSEILALLGRWENPIWTLRHSPCARICSVGRDSAKAGATEERSVDMREEKASF